MQTRNDLLFMVIIVFMIIAFLAIDSGTLASTDVFSAMIPVRGDAIRTNGSWHPNTL
jgi:hypothetical protein